MPKQTTSMALPIALALVFVGSGCPGADGTFSTGDWSDVVENWHDYRLRGGTVFEGTITATGTCEYETEVAEEVFLSTMSSCESLIESIPYVEVAPAEAWGPLVTGSEPVRFFSSRSDPVGADVFVGIGEGEFEAGGECGALRFFEHRFVNPSSEEDAGILREELNGIDEKDVDPDGLSPVYGDSWRPYLVQETLSEEQQCN